MHENGILTKQSSPYFQTVSCHNNITNNVMYNGPRAGINMNDGFGGGDLISGNLIFNMVRETNDHGPINTVTRPSSLFSRLPPLSSRMPFQR